MIRQRRGEILLYTTGVIGVLAAIAYLSVQFPVRVDMTEEGKYSLLAQTVTMLKRLEKPVHITFFHDPLMRETVELYELMARQNDKLTLDSSIRCSIRRRRACAACSSPARRSSRARAARCRSTGPPKSISPMPSRYSLGVTQKVCFLDGHREPDPFSIESHDHMEGTAGHSHGLGSVYEMHQQHGMAKARNALETLNYTVEKISLSQSGSGETLAKCSLLVVAGPKLALLPMEVDDDPTLSCRWRQCVLPARSVRPYRPRAGPARIRHRPGRRYRDRRGQPFLGRSVVARRHRLQLSPDRAGPSTDLLPGRPVFLADAPTHAPDGRHSAGQLLEAELRTNRPQTRHFDKGKDLPGPLTMMAVAVRDPPDPARRRM